MAVRPESPIQKLNRLKSAAKHARLPFEKDWWLNTAFYLGEQYTEWYEPIQNIRRIPRDDANPDAPRPVVNKINHFVNQQLAFALQNKPTADVMPTSDDLIAASESSVALAYCQYASEVSSYPEVEETASHWALVAGTAFKKWTWDPVLKRPVVAARTPFDLLLDPYAVTWNDVRWIIDQRFLDPEQVYDIWGKRLKLKPERVDETRAAMMRAMGTAPAVEGITVNEIWMKPTRDRPKGLFAIWADQEFIVPPQDLPYPDLAEAGKLPFSIQGVVPRPGTPYYDSRVKYLRPAQMELNKFHAQLIMMRENHANLKWWEPEEANLQAPISNAPFQVLRGSGAGGPGSVPAIINPGSLPLSGDDGSWITEEMMNVVGLHEVSQAQVPGRVESAKAIEMLKEADATNLSTLSGTTERGIEHGFWCFTAYAKQFEPEKKLVAVYSEDGVQEVKEFRAQDIDLGLRYRVTMGTGLGYSRAGRAENLYNLWDRGLLQDDPARMLSLLDVGGNLPLASSARDVKLARNENIEMKNGTAVKPNSWDNHAIHLREHNDFRKTLEYRLLSVRGQAIFEFHCKLHEQLFLVELNKQATYAAASQGALQQPPSAGDPAAQNPPPEESGSAGGDPAAEAEPSPEPMG